MTERASIDHLRGLLATCPLEDLDRLLSDLEADPRVGVRSMAAVRRRALASEAAETARLDGLMRHQLDLHTQGYGTVAGVDEVGRGALAGPLTVAAVVLDPASRIEGLDDSKRLTPQRREAASVLIHARALSVAIVHIPAEEIDAVGIREAVRLGMMRSVQALHIDVDHVLVDGNDARLERPCTAVVGGDALCACIAAASVVAKVARDALMRSLAPEYPGFDFEINKGYGTLEHIEAIRTLGPTPLHRRSFGPCAQPPLF